MISQSGWCDWAVREPGPPEKVNGGTNIVAGIFLHSAEGYLAGLRSQLHGTARVSWHFSTLFDGTLIQHYPVWAQCWHATAANNNYIGNENEGKVPEHPTLTDAQVATNRRLIADLEALKGWKGTRTGDRTQTLWEHKEVVWLGGTSTTCPNGRIPWNLILEETSMPEPQPTKEQALDALVNAAAIIVGEIGTTNLENLTPQDKSALKWIVETAK